MLDNSDSPSHGLLAARCSRSSKDANAEGHVQKENKGRDVRDRWEVVLTLLDRQPITTTVALPIVHPRQTRGVFRHILAIIIHERRLEMADASHLVPCTLSHVERSSR